MVNAFLSIACLENRRVVDQLAEYADQLEASGEHSFRVQAYRNASRVIAELELPVKSLIEQEGVVGLTRLDGIGKGIAASIGAILRHGTLPQLERIRNAAEPEKAFATVADIGPILAHRIHDQLGIATLAELEEAANDGRLERVGGIGKKRATAVRETLAGRFHHELPGQYQPPLRDPARELVPVSELLAFDRKYRDLAKRDKLPRVAPRRFNPSSLAWLPIMKVRQDPRSFQVFFSNSPAAHRANRIRDWVVIVDDLGDQWTVVTARYGQLKGRRIVCGREGECRRFYQQQKKKRELPLFPEVSARPAQICSETHTSMLPNESTRMQPTHRP